jgi:hypothetical protein
VLLFLGGVAMRNLRGWLTALCHAAMRRIGPLSAPWPEPNEAYIAVRRAEAAAGRLLPGLDIDETAMLRLWSHLTPLIEEAPFTEKKTASRRRGGLGNLDSGLSGFSA